MLFPLLFSSHPAPHHQHRRQEILVQGLVCKGSNIKLDPDNVNLEHRYSLSMSLKKREQHILSEDKTVLSLTGNTPLHMPSYIWLQLYCICMFSFSPSLSVLLIHISHFAIPVSWDWAVLPVLSPILLSGHPLCHLPMLDN